MGCGQYLPAGINKGGNTEVKTGTEAETRNKKAGNPKNQKGLKAGCMAALWVMLVLMLFLIPVNIFLVNFPGWVMSVLCILLCCGLAAYFLYFKTGRALKIILPVVFVGFSLVCSFAPYLIPYWNSYTFKGYSGKTLNYDELITGREAAEDLKALKYYLEKVHPAFQDGLTEGVNLAYEEVLARLEKAEQITVNDFRREIQTVLHPIGDAHTTTYNNYPDDKYLSTAPQKICQGYGIRSVNGKTVKEIIEEAKPYYCYETEEGINIDLGSLASLDFYGFSAPLIYEWSRNGEIIRESCTEADFVSWEEYLEIYEQYSADEEAEESRDFVFYEIDEEKSLAVLILTQCNYNQTYIDCIKEMFTQVKEKKIHTVAVDLRGNGGGNSMVGNEFVKYLPVDSYADGPYDWRWGPFMIHGDGFTTNKRYEDLTFDGSVYVLTDRNSFSSAKDFAMLIQDNHLGQVLGEASANSVNGYGEVAAFYLPNTGLFVQISTKKWYRIDGNNSEDYVLPDFPCESGQAMGKLYEVIAAGD